MTEADTVQIAAAYFFDNAIHVLVDGTCYETDHASYVNWRQRNKGSFVVIADTTFPYAHDLEFELLLSIEYRIEHMWRKDLLAYWWWERHKTGIASVRERLEALMEASRIPPRAPPVLI